MEKALLYKEWKKTNKIVFGTVVASLLMLLYFYINLGSMFLNMDMEHIWDIVINRKQFLFKELRFLPLLIGVCFGIVQYLPETLHARIKLSLHLPLNEGKVIFIMLSYGSIFLFSLFAFHTLGIIGFARFYFTKEFIYSILQTVAPWYLAGIIGYGFVAMVCLEPSLRRKIFNGLLGAATVQVCFTSNMPAALTPILEILGVITAIVIGFGFLSVNRFKQGVK